MGIDINNQGLYLNDAIKKILEEMDTLIVNNEILHKEEINLEEALGKVSMEEILSEEDMPGYRSSVMDGYALGESSKGNKWKIVGESFPGKPFNDLLKKGEAVTISTGSFVPDNCFSVIPQEQVSLEFLKGNEYILKKETSSNNSWIREKNDQVFKGEILIKKGVKITPGILSKLASCGIKTIKVSKISKLGLLITGDELIKSGTARRKGEIWESNSILIKSIAKNLGFEINEIHIEKDNYQNIKNSLRNISEFNDVVISVGGISVGKKDFLKDIINEIGEIKFWKLFLKPGKPFAFGLINKKIPYFGLPGNPVSCFMSLTNFLPIYINSYYGKKIINLKFIEFQSKSFIEKNENLTLFQRVIIKNKKFEIIKNQDSSLINMLKVSNGILIRTPYSKSIKPNEKIKILVYDGIDNQKLLTS